MACKSWTSISWRDANHEDDVFFYWLYTQINDPCNSHLGKQKKSFPLSATKSEILFSFKFLHKKSDIWGPVSIPTILSHRSFLTVVEDKSRFTCLYFMKNKTIVASNIRSFVSFIHTQFNRKVKCIRSDNGLEFLLKDFYSDKGIIHQTSCVETPQ